MILLHTPKIYVWEKETGNGAGYLATAGLLLLLVFLWSESLILPWQANVGQSSKMRSLENIVGKGRELGNNMHAFSLISGVVQSTDPPALRGDSDKRFQFPCGLF